MDEYKKDFYSRKYCWILDGKTFFNAKKAKQYLIDLGRSENFTIKYLGLLRDEYLDMIETD